jgi:hypothetical protein
MSSYLPGVKPATLNGMILYYRLMTKRSGLGDSTELSRVGLSQEADVLAGEALRPLFLCACMSESEQSVDNVLNVND